jgi:hypothetical protein
MLSDARRNDDEREMFEIMGGEMASLVQKAVARQRQEARNERMSVPQPRKLSERAHLLEQKRAEQDAIERVAAVQRDEEKTRRRAERERAQRARAQELHDLAVARAAEDERRKEQLRALREAKRRERDAGLPYGTLSTAIANGETATQWVACSTCDQWRKVPPEAYALIASEPEGTPWYCAMNTWSVYNRCDMPQEPDDDAIALSNSTNLMPPPSSRGAPFADDDDDDDDDADLLANVGRDDDAEDRTWHNGGGPRRRERSVRADRTHETEDAYDALDSDVASTSSKASRATTTVVTLPRAVLPVSNTHDNGAASTTTTTTMRAAQASVLSKSMPPPPPLTSRNSHKRVFEQQESNDNDDSGGDNNDSVENGVSDVTPQQFLAMQQLKRRQRKPVSLFVPSP